MKSEQQITKQISEHKYVPRATMGDNVNTEEEQRRLAEHPFCTSENVKLHTPSQAQHSPLPWHVSHQLADGYSIAREIALNCGRLLHIATVHPANSWGEKISIGEAKANAAFIVRACNNVQRLADALKLTLDALFNETADCNDSPWIVDVKRQAREALAQWEGTKSNE